MCLRTKDPTIHIAEENMVCYKSGSVQPNYFKSFAHYRFEYKIDEPTVKVNLVPYKDEYSHAVTVHIVQEGYHSYLSQHDAQPGDIGAFIIPKGAKYVRGWFNDDSHIPNYVSEQLIYAGPIGRETERKILWKYHSKIKALTQELKWLFAR